MPPPPLVVHVLEPGAQRLLQPPVLGMGRKESAPDCLPKFFVSLVGAKGSGPIIGREARERGCSHCEFLNVLAISSDAISDGDYFEAHAEVVEADEFLVGQVELHCQIHEMLVILSL